MWLSRALMLPNLLSLRVVKRSERCNAPSRSSHELGFKRAELPRAAITEGLVRALGIIPMDPLSNGVARFGEGAEVVLPDAFFLETAKEAFDDAVLLRCIRCDERLSQTVIATGGTKASRLEDKTVVAAYHRRRTSGTQRAEPCQASLLEGPFGLLGTTA